MTILLKRDFTNSINRRMILLLGFMVILQTWFILGSGSIDYVMQSGQMNFMAVVFSLNLFGPIIAMVLSYDSISVDRESKIIDLILTSGISKKKVVVSRILNSLITSGIFAISYVLLIFFIYLFAARNLGTSLLVLRYAIPATVFLFIYNLLGLLLSIVFRSAKIAFIVSVVLGVLLIPKTFVLLVDALAKSIGFSEKATEMIYMISPTLIMNTLSSYAEKSQVILGILLFITYITVLSVSSILVFSKQDEFNYGEKE